MSPFLVIRADANRKIGLGHVMRCIALGQAWQDAGGQVLFIGCYDFESIQQRINNEGFELISLLTAFPESADDLNQTLQHAKDKNAQWVVLDGYHFDLTYQTGLRLAGLKLLCVDDYCHQSDYAADILLNQNISAFVFSYQHNKECRMLLGTKFVMLRREFRKIISIDRAPHDLQNILVTMGGSDPDNATRSVIDALEKTGASGLNIKVLVGPANIHLESLREAVIKGEGNYELVRSVQDMPALIAWADFAVSAAGSTCWELAVLGIPFATLILVDNQEKLARQLEKRAGVWCAGWLGADTSERLAVLLTLTLPDSIAVQNCRDGLAGLVDRFGVDRVLYRPAIESGLNLFTDRLNLRSVRMDDASLLIEWANDLETRENSFNTDFILWENHVVWLEKKLQAPDALLYILELDGVPCGHIRYDREVKNSAVLSFMVAPNFRGIGLGSYLVETSCNIPIKKWKVSSVKAITFVENQFSFHIFERVGFIRKSDEIIQEHACRIYEWSGE